MKFHKILLFASSVILGVGCKPAADVGQRWAVLVASSSGYDNYRHQADVCHAYQVLKETGFPMENVITMMYDDIADDPSNPTPGIVINEPNGPDVYAGVKIDYRREDVTPQNFLAVLKGDVDSLTLRNANSTGRVLNSGPDDIVFVNIVDHGGPGVIGFPSSELHAVELAKAFTNMTTQKKFKKMVWYVEACYSGSMFDDILEDDSDIFVMTAADPYESSYACYLDEKRNVYLGDVFSVNWMDKIEQETLHTASLHHIYEKTRHNTTTSHVEEYGDLDIGNTNITQVVGLKVNAVNSRKKLKINPNQDAVPSLDVPLALLHRSASKSNCLASANKCGYELKTFLKKRKLVDTTVNKIASKISRNGGGTSIDGLVNSKTTLNKQSMECYKRVIETFSEKCFEISKNPYVLTKLQLFVNACNYDGSMQDDIISAVTEVCARSGINKDMRVL